MNATFHLRRLALTALFLLSPSSFLLAQGPLTPPGGPAPTMRTLDQLDAKLEKRTPISSLPVTISASGSYYLTGNLTALASGNGITINASNVTLDLGGFEVVGNGGVSNFGIRVSVNRTNVTLRNGTVRNWTGSGVVVENTAVSGVRVEDVNSLANGSAGIVLGVGSVVVDCMVSGNVAHGIQTGADCLVLRCTSRGNTPSGDGINVGARCAVRECVTTGNSGDGIQTGDFCEVTSCRVSGNTQQGVLCTNGCVLRDCTADGNNNIGFQCGDGVAATGCTATANGSAGFFFGLNARLIQCTATANTGAGIDATTGSTVQACVAVGNGTNGITVGIGSVVADSVAKNNSGISGISLAINCTASGCTVDGNTNSGLASQGIFGGNGCLITRCTVNGTLSTAGALNSGTGAGIVVLSGSTVQECKVRSNVGDGIRAGGDCRIVDNACANNGNGTGDGAGIHVTGQGNRIDGNHVTANERGIDVDVSANTVIRNTAAGNVVNYDIVANNSIGAIVIPGNSVLINTNVGQASSLGTTDPWANFSE